MCFKKTLIWFFTITLVFSFGAARELAYPVDEQILIVDSESKDSYLLKIPTTALMVFAITEDFILYGAEMRAVLQNSDEWPGLNLWLYDRANLQSLQLTKDREVIRAVWSQATNQICYWTRHMEIYLVDPDLRIHDKLTDHAATPAFSPDGTQIAYAALPKNWVPGSLPGAFDLHLLDLSERSIQTLAVGFDDAEPIWKPDGSGIIFTSGRSSITSLWQINSDGSNLAQITNLGLKTINKSFISNPGNNSLAHFSPDGFALLYSNHDYGNAPIHLLRWDELSGIWIHEKLGVGYDPVWLDSDRIAFIESNKSGLNLIEMDYFGKSKQVTTLGVQRLMSYRDFLLDQSVTLNIEEEPESSTFEEQRLESRAVPKFRLPLSSNPGYSAYYDNNAGSGLRDWRCGTNTYNGHKGTDFLATLNSRIYAGATGRVVYVNDGCSDVGGLGSTCGGGFGNYVKIDHYSGWFTYYAHMKKGTLIANNSLVSCGNQIGRSASSGNSSGYHLHFEVRKYSYPYNDPFAGGSCSGSMSFWTNQNNGSPTTECQ